MPVEIYFAGFKSNTYELQQSGWQLSAEQAYEKAAMRIAMKHEGARLYMLTNWCNYSAWQAAATATARGHYQASALPPLTVTAVFADGRVTYMETTHKWNFTPIDAMPQYADTTSYRFEDFVPFKPLNRDAPAIYVPEHTVPELLDLIMQKQDPKQQEIRERMRRESMANREANVFGIDPSRNIKAQIFTFAA